MSDKDKAMQQALEALIDAANVLSAPMFADAVDALKAALEQPMQEPVAYWNFNSGFSHCMIDPLNEAAKKNPAPLYTTPPQQQAEPVSMRMPKVGDKVICLEDESLGTVVSLTAGGSPDIKFDDGSHGTYLLREFAELFGYAEQRQPLTKDEALTLEALKYAASKGDGRIVREMKIAPFVIKDETLAQAEQEPMAWDKPSASFNEWWNVDYEDPANPFEKDSHGYWAWAGWKAAQRPWVGLNDVDVKNLELTSATSSDVRNISAELKEKNT